MKNKNKIGIILILFLLTIGTANATVISLNASGDTWVRQAFPDNNYGNTSSLWIRYAPPSSYNGLVTFDLSSIPNGSKINSATLYLYEYTGGNLGTVVSVYNVTSSWNESNVTWNTKPTYQEPLFSSANGLDNIGWMSWGITDTVKSWIGGRYGSIINNGIFVNATTGANIYQYSTKDNGSNIPYLSIDYTANSVPVMQTNSIAPLTAYKTDTLTATASAADADSDSITYAYQWYVGGSAIGGATSSTLSPPTIEGGSYKVLVTPSDAYGSGTGTYSNIVVIQGSSTNYTDYTINYSIPLSKILEFCVVDSSTSCTDSFFIPININYSYGYVNWSITDIPQNHSIKLAQASFTKQSGSGDVDVNVSRITSSWNNTITLSNQPSLATAESVTVVGGGSRYNWDITQMFTSWNTLSNVNYGFVLRRATNTNPSSVPLIYVKDLNGRIDVDINNYKPYPQNFQIDIAVNNTLVTNSTPNFTWTPFDGDGDSINITDIQVWNGSGATGTQFLSYNENSNLTSFVYNGTALTINSTYYVRIRLYDWAGAGNWYEYSFFYGQKPVINSASMDTTSPTAGNTFTLTFNATSQYGTITDANVTITRDSLSTLTYNYTDSEIIKNGDIFTITVTTPTSPVPLVYNVTTIEVKDSNGFTNISNYTFTITTVAPVVSSGGGGGGGGSVYIPPASILPTTTSLQSSVNLSIMPFVEGVRSLSDIEAINKCLTESFFLNNQCTGAVYVTMQEQVNYLSLILGALFGAVGTLYIMTAFGKKKRSIILDSLIYATFTMILVLAANLAGFNFTYILNYLMGSSMPVWLFFSSMMWSFLVSIVLDEWVMKREHIWEVRKINL